MENVVLYAVDGDGSRRPLLSLDPSDVFAKSKILHAAGAEFHRARFSGIAHPELRVINENHGDEEFSELHPETLEPHGDAGIVSNLETLFPVKEPEAPSKERLALEAKIQAMISTAVEKALAVQQKQIDAQIARGKLKPVSTAKGKLSPADAKPAAAKAKAKAKGK